MLRQQTGSKGTSLRDDRLVNTPTRRRLWIAAGALLIAHVVLLFAGAGFTHSLQLGDSPTAATAALVGSSMTRNFAGGYLSYIGLLDLLVVGLLLARLLWREGEVSGWLSSLVSGSAITYVAVMTGTGFAAGAAALYGGHHGAGLGTITVVNDIRNFGFVLCGALIGLFVLSLALAGRASRDLPRWLSYSGTVIGAIGIVAVPGARLDLANVTHMLSFLWLIALAVVALRRGGRPAGGMVGSGTVPA